MSNNTKKEAFDKVFRTFPNMEQFHFNVIGFEKRNVSGMISSLLEAYERDENKRHLSVLLRSYKQEDGNGRKQELEEMPKLWLKMKDMTGIAGVTSFCEITEARDVKYYASFEDLDDDYPSEGPDSGDGIGSMVMKTKFVKGAAECVVLKKYYALNYGDQP